MRNFSKTQSTGEMVGNAILLNSDRSPAMPPRTPADAPTVHGIHHKHVYSYGTSKSARKDQSSADVTKSLSSHMSLKSASALSQSDIASYNEKTSPISQAYTQPKYTSSPLEPPRLLPNGETAAKIPRTENSSACTESSSANSVTSPPRLLPYGETSPSFPPLSQFKISPSLLEPPALLPFGEKPAKKPKVAVRKQAIENFQTSGTLTHPAALPLTTSSQGSNCKDIIDVYDPITPPSPSSHDWSKEVPDTKYHVTDKVYSVLTLPENLRFKAAPSELAQDFASNDSGYESVQKLNDSNKGLIFCQAEIKQETVRSCQDETRDLLCHAMNPQENASFINPSLSPNEIKSKSTEKLEDKSINNQNHPPLPPQQATVSDNTRLHHQADSNQTDDSFLNRCMLPLDNHAQVSRTTSPSAELIEFFRYLREDLTASPDNPKKSGMAELTGETEIPIKTGHEYQGNGIVADGNIFNVVPTTSQNLEHLHHQFKRKYDHTTIEGGLEKNSGTASLKFINFPSYLPAQEIQDFRAEDALAEWEYYIQLDPTRQQSNRTPEGNENEVDAKVSLLCGASETELPQTKATQLNISERGEMNEANNNIRDQEPSNNSLLYSDANETRKVKRFKTLMTSKSFSETFVRKETELMNCLQKVTSKKAEYGDECGNLVDDIEPPDKPVNPNSKLRVKSEGDYDSLLSTKLCRQNNRLIRSVSLTPVSKREPQNMTYANCIDPGASLISETGSSCNDAEILPKKKTSTPKRNVRTKRWRRTHSSCLPKELYGVSSETQCLSRKNDENKSNEKDSVQPCFDFNLQSMDLSSQEAIDWRSNDDMNQCRRESMNQCNKPLNQCSEEALKQCRKEDIMNQCSKEDTNQGSKKALNPCFTPCIKEYINQCIPESMNQPGKEDMKEQSTTKTMLNQSGKLKRMESQCVIPKLKPENIPELNARAINDKNSAALLNYERDKVVPMAEARKAETTHVDQTLRENQTISSFYQNPLASVPHWLSKSALFRLQEPLVDNNNTASSSQSARIMEESSTLSGPNAMDYEHVNLTRTEDGRKTQECRMEFTENEISQGTEIPIELAGKHAAMEIQEHPNQSILKDTQMLTPLKCKAATGNMNEMHSHKEVSNIEENEMQHSLNFTHDEDITAFRKISPIAVVSADAWEDVPRHSSDCLTNTVVEGATARTGTKQLDNSSLKKTNNDESSSGVSLISEDTSMLSDSRGSEKTRDENLAPNRVVADSLCNSEDMNDVRIGHGNSLMKASPIVVDLQNESHESDKMRSVNSSFKLSPIDVDLTNGSDRFNNMEDDENVSSKSGPIVVYSTSDEDDSNVQTRPSDLRHTIDESGDETGTRVDIENGFKSKPESLGNRVTAEETRVKPNSCPTTEQHVHNEELESTDEEIDVVGDYVPQDIFTKEKKQQNQRIEVSAPGQENVQQSNGNYLSPPLTSSLPYQHSSLLPWLQDIAVSSLEAPTFGVDPVGQAVTRRWSGHLKQRITETTNQRSTEAMNQCSTETMNQCSTEAMNLCSTEAMNLCSTEAMNQCGIEVMNQCSTEATNNLCSTEAMNQYSTEAMNRDSRRKLSQCSTEAMNLCSTEAMNQCSTEAMNQCSTEAINQCSTEAINQCSTEAMNLCSTEAMNQCNIEAMNQRSTEVMNQRSTEVMNQRTTEAMNQRSTNYKSQCNVGAMNQCNPLSPCSNEVMALIGPHNVSQYSTENNMCNLNDVRYCSTGIMNQCSTEALNQCRKDDVKPHSEEAIKQGIAEAKLQCNTTSNEENRSMSKANQDATENKPSTSSQRESTSPNYTDPSQQCDSQFTETRNNPTDQSALESRQPLVDSTPTPTATAENDGDKIKSKINPITRSKPAGRSSRNKTKESRSAPGGTFSPLQWDNFKRSLAQNSQRSMLQGFSESHGLEKFYSPYGLRLQATQMTFPSANPPPMLQHQGIPFRVFGEPHLRFPAPNYTPSPIPSPLSSCQDDRQSPMTDGQARPQADRPHELPSNVHTPLTSGEQVHQPVQDPFSPQSFMMTKQGPILYSQHDILSRAPPLGHDNVHLMHEPTRLDPRHSSNLPYVPQLTGLQGALKPCAQVPRDLLQDTSSGADTQAAPQSHLPVSQTSLNSVASTPSTHALKSSWNEYMQRWQLEFENMMSYLIQHLPPQRLINSNSSHTRTAATERSSETPEQTQQRPETVLQRSADNVASSSSKDISSSTALHARPASKTQQSPASSHTTATPSPTISPAQQPIRANDVETSTKLHIPATEQDLQQTAGQQLHGAHEIYFPDKGVHPSTLCRINDTSVSIPSTVVGLFSGLEQLHNYAPSHDSTNSRGRMVAPFESQQTLRSPVNAPENPSKNPSPTQLNWRPQVPYLDVQRTETEKEGRTNLTESPSPLRIAQMETCKSVQLPNPDRNSATNLRPPHPTGMHSFQQTHPSPYNVPEVAHQREVVFQRPTDFPGVTSRSPPEPGEIQRRNNTSLPTYSQTRPQSTQFSVSQRPVHFSGVTSGSPPELGEIQRSNTSLPTYSETRPQFAQFSMSNTGDLTPQFPQQIQQRPLEFDTTDHLKTFNKVPAPPTELSSQAIGESLQPQTSRLTGETPDTRPIFRSTDSHSHQNIPEQLQQRYQLLPAGDRLAGKSPTGEDLLNQPPMPPLIRAELHPPRQQFPQSALFNPQHCQPQRSMNYPHPPVINPGNQPLRFPAAHIHNPSNTAVSTTAMQQNTGGQPGVHSPLLLVPNWPSMNVFNTEGAFRVGPDGTRPLHQFPQAAAQHDSGPIRRARRGRKKAY